MVLEFEQLVNLSKDKEPDSWIKLARKESNTLKMHFYGTGLTKYLSKVQGLESEAQVELRQKYAISNQAIVETLLRPVDNAWGAKGGVTTIDASEKAQETVKESIQNVSEGYNLNNYLQHIWFDRFITDPNGLLFNEVKDGKTFLTYKSIHDISHMLVNGIQPEYIVFEPDTVLMTDSDNITVDESKREEFFWVVDDAYYYRVKRSNEGVVILDQIDNTFGVVPATQNSPIFDTEKRIKVSPIHKQLDLLESYLIDNSINNIYKKLHGYPVFWMYSQKCDSCKGTGEVEGKSCGTCGGTGQSMKKDVSDALLLATPRDSDAPTIAPNVAGYIAPDLATWQEQRTELDHIYNLIYFSQWGTTQEQIGDNNATATGRFIDTQPVMNRLNMYSDVIEVIKTRTIEMFVKFDLPNTDVNVHVSEGRRYLIETPDQIWIKYLNTIEKGADDSSKDLQLSQYYEAEFQSDEFMKQYYLKLMRVEPLVHYSVPDVIDMAIGQEIKDMKVAFTYWKNLTPMADVIEKELEVLIKSLKDFTDEWKKESGTQVQGTEV